MKYIFTLLSFLIFTLSISAQCAEGDCENGTGVMVFDSGNKYRGQFKNGMRHGEGTFVWASGAKYQGDWIKDKREGKGRYIYPDRRYYDGDWVMDKKEGKGTLFSENGEILLKGAWKDDEFIDPDELTRSYLSVGGSALTNIFYDIPARGESRYINPITLSYDIGITPSLTVGGLVGYSFSNFSPSADNSISSESNYTHLIVGGRALYHFLFIKGDRFIPYVGGLAGYELISGDTGGNLDFTEPESRFTYNAVVGTKIFITKRLGAFIEGGLGFSNLNFGATLRI